MCVYHIHVCVFIIYTCICVCVFIIYMYMCMCVYHIYMYMCVCLSYTCICVCVFIIYMYVYYVRVFGFWRLKRVLVAFIVPLFESASKKVLQTIYLG